MRLKLGESNLNELQRMQYLEVLGVDMFAPRWLLPGASVSHQCLLPAASSLDTIADTRSQSCGDIVSAGRPEQSDGSLVGSLLKSVSSPKIPVVRERVELLLPENAQQAQQATFSLAFWRVHPQVIVVDSRLPKALPTVALLQAVVSALGVSRSPLPRAEIQNWPVSGGGDKSWDAAREMMQAFLESHLHDQPARYLVLMGHAAVKVIASGAVDEPAVNEKKPVKLEQFGCELLVTPSLTQLLLEPEKKAGLWQLLAPLRNLADTQASH